MKQKIKYKILILVAVFSVATVAPTGYFAQARGCPEIRVVFARGSGGERWTDDNYLEYKNTIEEKLKTTNLSYDFIDLDYPAVGVGIENLAVTLGAFFGAGEAYEFGNSVQAGVNNLVLMVNGLSCPETKYILGGYSQGAMVVSKALPRLKPERIIYAATFGDPKIYLPEGAGPVPVACGGRNLSEYRMYVPDCQAHRGKLGGYVPYRPNNFIGKVGTWCNKRDIFCSSRFSITDHISYVTDELYADASKVIFDKICKAFGLENRISSPHDTAILIDSTGSMSSMIDRYKNEAERLAKETLDAGGRVALYDYRDLADPYQPVEHCNFETCTLEVFVEKLRSIEIGGGGDGPESLLSASFHAMKALKWKQGATKSLVILTDDELLNPDRDGITLEQTVKLSKEIDPVNFYIITKPEFAENYRELAEKTDGMVVTDLGKLDLLTDFIMDRYDSLPRVEEMDSVAERPIIEVLSSEQVTDNAWQIKFETNAEKTMVAVNDWFLGMTEEQTIVVNNLDFEKENVLTLVPISGDASGDSVNIVIGTKNRGAGGIEAPRFLPKAPNTGRR